MPVKMQIKVNTLQTQKLPILYGKMTFQAVRMGLEDALEYLKHTLIRNLPKVYGALRKSIKTEIVLKKKFFGVSGVGGDIIAIGSVFIGKTNFRSGSSITSPEKYGRYLEYGTKPNPRVPLRPIIEWVQRRFGVYDKEAWKSARGVQKRIKAEGTDANSVFKKVWSSHRGRVISIYRFGFFRSLSGFEREG